MYPSRKGKTVATMIRSANEKVTQKEIEQSDAQTEEHCEQIDGDIFNRQQRFANLREGAFTAEKDTIFSAIFEELKRRKRKGR